MCVKRQYTIAAGHDVVIYIDIFNVVSTSVFKTQYICLYVNQGRP